MSRVAGFSQLAEQYKDETNLSARQRIYHFHDPRATPWPRWVFDQLDLPAQARVLEVGCGNGVLWAQNVERVPAQWEVTLSDMSLGILHDARQKLGNHAGRFHFEEFDAQAIPHPNQSFDCVIANHMLYHVPDRNRAVGEFGRILKSGGKLLAATNGGGHLAQLFELIQRFIPLPEELRGGSFRLETGEAELRRHFSSVTLRRQCGDLQVTDPAAIVDYALSIEDAKSILVGQKLRDFAAEAEQRTRGEGFRIQTDVGLFHCVK